MSAAIKKAPTYWILGSYKHANKCLAAVRALRAEPQAKIELDVYSAYPLHGVEEALGLKKSKVPLIVLICGLFGAINGYGIQTWTNATSSSWFTGAWLGSLRGYLINVGGRTPHAWPLNIPITFELGVLIGSFGALIGMLILNGLPRHHHPVFEVEAFRSAQIDRHWLSIATQEGDKLDALKEKLGSLGAEEISSVVEEEIL
jgi:hypothetical protein